MLNFSKLIPEEAMNILDERLNQLYFSEHLESIDYTHYQAGSSNDKMEFFAAKAKEIIRINCHLREELNHGLAIRLGMNFRYIIRASSKDNIVLLCNAIALAIVDYCTLRRRSYPRLLDKNGETYRNLVFNDIIESVSLNSPDRALKILSKFEEYHRSYTFGCPNLTSIDKLSVYARSILEKQKVANHPDEVDALLQTMDGVVFDGVIYSIKHVSGTSRSALISSLFKINSSLNILTGVNFTTSWINKFSRTHQGCKTRFRNDLMTSARLALHDVMLRGLQKIPGEEADALKGLMKGASVEKILMPLPFESVRSLAMKQYHRARELVDIGGTATSEDAELVTFEIMILPPVFLDQLKRQGTRFFVCREGITEVLQDLKGQIPPGYTNGQTWDTVLGVNCLERNVVVVATTTGPDGKRWVPPKGFRHGCENICIHELAHAFDLNESEHYKRPFNYNNQPSFVNARTADLHKLTAYFLQPEPRGSWETFAESASRYFGGDPTMQADWPNLYDFWHRTDILWREKYPEGWIGQ